MAGSAGGRRGSGVAPSAAAGGVADLLVRFKATLPKLIVFDLDYTLWPFWCECYSPSHSPWLYPDVPAILDGLEQAGVEMALASRTPTPHVANAFIDKLNLRSRFRSIQLIPAADGFDHTTAQKDTAHLPNIRQETGHCYADMLFFDDESGNVKKVSRLGVVSILVDTATGVSLASLEHGLQTFANSKASSSSTNGA